jgi:hypothetical protein
MLSAALVVTFGGRGAEAGHSLILTLDEESICDAVASPLGKHWNRRMVKSKIAENLFNVNSSKSD